MTFQRILGTELDATIIATVTYSIVMVCVAATSRAADSANSGHDGTSAVFIGTYTDGASDGIYRAVLDHASGGLRDLRHVAITTNPSFLALHPNGRYLYAVNETGDFQGEKSGALTSFAIETDGSLRALGQIATDGQAPCHLEVDPTGSYVLVANYTSGNIGVFQIDSTGNANRLVSFAQHTGSSVNLKRQQGPHAHGIYLHPAGDKVYVADLGLDQVRVYGWNRASGALEASHPASYSVQPGAGPRHLTFTPDGQYLYVINELDNTVNAFSLNDHRSVQSISTLPEDFTGISHTSELMMHPSGRFVYGSNRGHDSIAAYEIDTTTGRLALLEIESTGGRTPRGFCVTPEGDFLLAGNQQSDTITSFRISSSGMLDRVYQMVNVPTPVCIITTTSMTDP